MVALIRLVFDKHDRSSINRVEPNLKQINKAGLNPR